MSVFAAIIWPFVRSQKWKEKKEKKEKNTIFVKGSQPSEIVGVLYRIKMRRKEFSAGWWWGRGFSPSGVGDGSEKREAVILSRVCPGEGVLVPLLLCVIPCSSHSLLLCLCCNVLLLCVLLAGRARRWLANCAGRVLHGSHCNALLSHYPLQERSPRVLPLFPVPFLPFHLRSPLLLTALPFFLLSSQNPCRAQWIGFHLHFQNRWVQQKTVELSFSFPHILHSAPLLHSPVLSLLFFL